MKNKIKIGCKVYNKEMIHDFEAAKKTKALNFVSCKALQNKAALKLPFFKLISTIDS
jgi:hypothetical protein